MICPWISTRVRELDGRRRFAYLAAALGIVYAGVSAYWAVGGAGCWTRSAAAWNAPPGRAEPRCRRPSGPWCFSKLIGAGLPLAAVSCASVGRSTSSRMAPGAARGGGSGRLWPSPDHRRAARPSRGDSSQRRMPTHGRRGHGSAFLRDASVSICGTGPAWPSGPGTRSVRDCPLRNCIRSPARCPVAGSRPRRTIPRGPTRSARSQRRPAPGPGLSLTLPDGRPRRAAGRCAQDCPTGRARRSRACPRTARSAPGRSRRPRRGPSQRWHRGRQW